SPAQLEDIYTVEDALLVGGMLITLMNHADRVRVACLAQLVNVIAPIMTQTGGSACRQTIFFPFQHASRYGRGTALKTLTTSPKHDSRLYTDVPWLETSAVWNEENGELTVFVLHRGHEAVETSLTFAGFEGAALREHIVYRHDDLAAINTIEQPDTALPGKRKVDAGTMSQGKGSVTFDPLSWNVLRFSDASNIPIYDLPV
ncbi:MAG TPA: alpha-L-arabinofuranosidase C-terminal domain-containing protein, partial [Clostridia bacterium]